MKREQSRLWLGRLRVSDAERPPVPRRRVLRLFARQKPQPLPEHVLGKIRRAWLDYAECMGILSPPSGAAPAALAPAASTTIHKCELVGATLVCHQAKNPSQVGLSGTVLNEGTAAIYLQLNTEPRVVTLMKKDCVFDIVFGPDDAAPVFRLVGASIDRNPITRTKAKPRILRSLDTIGS